MTTIFTFQYPAKIFTGETTAKFRTFKHGAFNVISFDQSGIYWDQKTRKIKRQSFDGVNEYWLEQNGFAIRLRTHNNDENIKSSIDHFSDLQSRFDSMIQDAKNPAQYEANAAEEFAARKAEREAEAIQRQKAEEFAAIVNEAEIENASYDFKADKFISAEHFEVLLKLHGVKIHIRTLGTIRNRVKTISISRAQTYGGFLPDSIWSAAKQLNERLK